MPEKIAGLPAHPLIIHLPLVLGPLVGLLTILLLAPGLRAKLLLPTAGLGILFAASAVAAVWSGEALARTLAIGGAISEHADAAETLRLLSLVLSGALIAFAIIRNRVTGLAGTGVALVVAVLGVATVGFTVKTGHEGASLVWEQRYDAAEEAQRSSGSVDGVATGDASAAAQSDDAPNGG